MGHESGSGIMSNTVRTLQLKQLMYETVMLQKF